MSAAGLAALLSSDGAFLHLGRETTTPLLQTLVVRAARPTYYAERDLRMPDNKPARNLHASLNAIKQRWKALSPASQSQVTPAHPHSQGPP
eukprot:1144601-Pelagomonas_calceolata.AAC.5